jgi:REP element-mobilizing transposase RayT
MMQALLTGRIRLVDFPKTNTRGWVMTHGQRRSIRLRGYDYSQAGAYFITICTQNRTCLFGEIVNDEMVLNDAGKMVLHWYAELENKFSDIQCDEFIYMPNHIHFIVVNTVGADLRVRPDIVVDRPKGEHIGSPLHVVVQWFKTMTTNAYIQGVKQWGWRRFDGKLWQRNYWEHVVRNESELNSIRAYILNNPAQWASDKLWQPSEEVS